MRYYRCTNCGHYEDFGKQKYKNLTCRNCDYSDILDLDEEDWQEIIKDRPWLENKNVIQEDTEK